MTFLMPMASITRVTKQFMGADIQDTVSRVFTRTFSYGDPDPTRRIFIVYAALSNTTPSSTPRFDDISVGGAIGPVTEIDTQRSGNRVFGLFCAHVPTGNSGTVTIRFTHTGSLGSSARMAAVYRLVGASSNVPFSTRSGGTIDVPALGVVVGGALWTTQPSPTWIGGLTYDDRQGSAAFASGEFDDADLAKSITLANSPPESGFAAYGP